MYLPDQFVRALAGGPVAPGGPQAADERMGTMASAVVQFTRRLARLRRAAGRPPAPGQFRQDLSKEPCCAVSAGHR